jgi:soluble epoxide hydrolase/lipid-phosphate phosphatase
MTLMAFKTLLSFCVISAALAKGFKPSAYEKQYAKCSAVVRDDPRNMKTTTLDISYVDVNPNNSKDTIVMVHGWPSLWSSWSNQITEFEKDHRVIALDQRGFGSSTHPGNVQTSASMSDLVGDLVCVLEHAGVEEALCMGHDWGTQVCYEAARQRPDIFTSVVGLTIPYVPYEGPMVPISQLAKAFPKLSYQIFFDMQTSDAAAELNKDKRRTLRGTLRDVASPPPDAFLSSQETFLGGWDAVPEIAPIPFMSKEEEDYLVEQYELQGFENTLYFYTTGPKYLSWKHARTQANYTIPCPVLSVLSVEDPVADWVLAAKTLKSSKYVPHLTTETVKAAHWPQLEKPEIVNGFIRKWMASDRSKPSVMEEKKESTERDEL